MSGHPAREKLGERLRACRKAADVTGTELAAQLGVSQSTISKIETGKARAPHDLVRQWLEHTAAAPEDRAELMELAEASTEITDWKQLHGRGWEAHQKSYSDLERSAAAILAFQNAVIPGLLQTAAYTSFLLGTVVGLPPADVGVGVTSRLARQSVLYESSTRLRVVLTEAVVRHRLGGPGVMAEQLHRLAELSRLRTVELGIIPIDTSMPSRYGPSFDLYDGLDGTSEALVVVELESGEVREDDPGRIESYRRRHDIYWSAALTGPAATAHLELLARQMTDSIFS